jgi:hypothetical protein
MKSLTGKDIAAVIGSVKSIFGFLALSVLALVALEYFAQKSANSTPLYVLIGAIVLLDAIATLIVFTRPEATDERVQFSDQFASLLGVAVYNGFDPYLRNLPQSEIDEALDYIRATLSVDRDLPKTVREKKFVEQFSAKVVAQGRILLKRGTGPRSAS